MAGPGQIADGGVVFGMLVAVADHHAEGRSGGLSVKHTGENLNLILFIPRGGKGAAAGGPAAQLRGQKLHIQLDAGGDIFQNDTDGRAMAFAKYCVIHDETSCMHPPNRQ